MSGKGRINLIWFRDEEPAKRLRIRAGWVRAGTYLLVLLVLAASGGAFTSWELWRRARDLQLDKRETEKRLSETMLKLERLQNIEKLLQTTDPTELSQLLAGLGLETPGNRSAQSSPQPQAAPAKGGKDQPGKDQAQAASRPAPERDKPAGFDLADVMGRTDLGQVVVENFRTKTDAKGLHYGFDLSNLMPQPLAGSGQLLLVARDGTTYPVQTGKDDLNFSIQRFKQVSAQAPLPSGADPAQVFGFRLILANASGKTIFSETYPLAPAQ